MSTDESATAEASGADLPVRRRANIPRALLDEHSLTVVRRLQRFGHEAYLVGGCVRDLLAGLEPKDFDVVTDAHPNRIKRVFRNARIIGRRFRLAHIRFGPRHVIETSTFRAPPDGEGTSENVFGTAPEDARRRDFTINALFYDPLEDEVIDWTGGLADLEAGIVRSIGEPSVRLREDPVRMIRAVHFGARLGFQLEPELERAIGDAAPTLVEASPARLYVELLKVLTRARARPTLHRLHDLGVLRYWLPELVRHLDEPVHWPRAAAQPSEPEADEGEPEDVPVAHATWNLLGAADRWGLATHDASEYLSLAALLAPWIAAVWRRTGHGNSYAAFEDVFTETLRPMAVRMSVPRRTSGRLRELIWTWLEIRRPPRTRRAAHVNRRRAYGPALDLLRLDLMARACPLDLLREWETRAPPRREPDSSRAARRRPRTGSRGGRRRRVGDGGAIREEAAAWTPAPDARGNREPPARRSDESPPPPQEARDDDPFGEGLLDS